MKKSLTTVNNFLIPSSKLSKSVVGISSSTQTNSSEFPSQKYLKSFPFLLITTGRSVFDKDWFFLIMGCWESEFGKVLKEVKREKVLNWLVGLELKVWREKFLGSEGFHENWRDWEFKEIVEDDCIRPVSGCDTELFLSMKNWVLITEGLGFKRSQAHRNFR